MRSADMATVFRTLLAILVVYLVIAKVSPILIAALIAVTMLLDAFDGYLAVREISKGKVSFATYMSAAAGNKAAAAVVKGWKQKVAKSSKHGARMDVAGDRVVEYSFWIVFTYLNVLPLYVLLIIVIRHSFVDAVMANKGTSSKMKTRFAEVVYSSPLGRGGINVVKFLAFSYLAFMYIWGAPALVGYALVVVLVAYIVLRGIAELYENM